MAAGQVQVRNYRYFDQSTEFGRHLGCLVYVNSVSGNSVFTEKKISDWSVSHFFTSNMAQI